VKFLAGLAVGLCFVLVAGAAVERYIVVLEGDFGKIGVYQPAFSGVSADGNCYLAITHTPTGRTEVFGITKDTNKKLTDNPFQMSSEGSIIIQRHYQP
jgi:hypothetical protein